MWHPDKVDGHPDALHYFTHVSNAYETLYDDHKRAIYDDDSIEDSEYFTLKVGPLKINLFVVFVLSLTTSISYFVAKKYGLLGSQANANACPVDHRQRVEMAKIANE